MQQKHQTLDHNLFLKGFIKYKSEFCHGELYIKRKDMQLKDAGSSPPVHFIQPSFLISRCLSRKYISPLLNADVKGIEILRRLEV